jgi:hypothetical protein
MPIIDIPEKVCSHCGKTRWYTRITKNGKLIQICSIKKTEYNKKWKVRFPDKAKAIAKRAINKVKDTDDYKTKNRARVKKWNQENPEKTKAKIKATMLKYKEKYDMASRERSKTYSKNLNDCYLAGLIRGETRGLFLFEIPKDLLELKRKQLLLFRQTAKLCLQ